MRRDGTVINLLRVCVSGNVWRILADQSTSTIRAVAIDGAASTVCVTRSSLLAQQRGRLKRVAGTAASDGGERQQAEAADNRVKDQCQAGRHRECDRTAHGQKANHCGNENQTSEHVLQPPREGHHQFASHAWQDCGRPWVNLRRINRLVGSGAARENRAFHELTIGCMLVNHTQPEIAHGFRPFHRQCKYMKNNQNTAAVSQSAVPMSLRVSRVFRALPSHAAIWHKSGAGESRHTPELTDPCLSFVIPDQQGARVTVFEAVL